jgi:hypothetical protein
LRVLRNFGTESIDNPGNLIINKNLELLPDEQSNLANGT